MHKLLPSALAALVLMGCGAATTQQAATNPPGATQVAMATPTNLPAGARRIPLTPNATIGNGTFTRGTNPDIFQCFLLGVQGSQSAPIEMRTVAIGQNCREGVINASRRVSMLHEAWAIPNGTYLLLLSNGWQIFIDENLRTISGPGTQ